MGVGAVLYEERAQATVEMAVVAPVLLALALIVYNVMVFAGAVARFDRVVPDIDQPWMTPTIDLLTHGIYSAQGSDVCLTMVDGKVLYRDGEYTTIDIEKVKYETQKETDAILAQL